MSFERHRGDLMAHPTCRHQLFAHKPVRDLRAISGKDVKIYSWSSAQLAALYYLFGPEHLGGRGNMRLKIEEEAARSGKPLSEVTLQVCVSHCSRCVDDPTD